MLTEVTDQATELLGVVAVELLPRRVGVEQAPDDLGKMTLAVAAAKENSNSQAGSTSAGSSPAC